MGRQRIESPPRDKLNVKTGPPLRHLVNISVLGLGYFLPEKNYTITKVKMQWKKMLLLMAVWCHWST